MDASDFSIGGVLTQADQPVALFLYDVEFHVIAIIQYMITNF